MALSDCERCWDTPCECGFEGYIAVYAPQELRQKLRDLPRGEFSRIRGELALMLRKELEK